jgi:hypothetical protein
MCILIFTFLDSKLEEKDTQMLQICHKTMSFCSILFCQLVWTRPNIDYFTWDQNILFYVCTPQTASLNLIKVYKWSFHRSCPVVSIIRYNFKEQLFLRRPYGIWVRWWGRDGI